MQCIGRTRNCFIRTNPVETAHENITKFQSIETMLNQARRKLKAGILLKSHHVNGNNRNIRVASLDQGTADKSDVVGGTTATAGLGNQDSSLSHIVIAGHNSAHNLPDDDQ